MSSDINQPIKICIQCGSKYQDIKNFEGHCLFHAAPSNYRRQYPCCSSNSPCQKSTHKEFHHTEYSYESFFNYAWDLLNYTDTINVWENLTDVDLNTESELNALVGKLLRKKSNGTLINENLLVVKAGRVVYNNKFIFKIYTQKEIEDIGKNGKTEIFKFSESENSKINLEWIIENSQVKGINLEVKSETSEKSKISKVFFHSYSSVLEALNIEKISSGGFGLKIPDKDYDDFPENLYSGFKFDTPTEIKPRQFKEHGEVPICIKVDEIASNRMSNCSSDLFEMRLNLLGTKNEVISIKNVKISWKLKGEKDWKEVTSFESRYNGVFKIDAMSSMLDFYKIYIKDEEKAKKQIRLFNKSWIARFQPIRFKFDFEDIFGKNTSQIIEYVNPPPYIPKKYDSDKLYLYVDNPELMCRSVLKIEDGDIVNGKIFKFEGEDYTESSLNKIVYEAIKTNQYEYLIKEAIKDEYTFSAYALIDKACKRIYAIKVIMHNDFASSLGYFKLPIYGITFESSSSILAVEKSVLPIKEFKTEKVIDYEEGETGFVIPKILSEEIKKNRRNR